MNIETKTAVTVAEMARMCGLSRARFYQLIGSTFPWPVYNVATKRPFFDEEAQRICLEVRRRNCGIDGRPVLFYARRLPVAVPKRMPKYAPQNENKCSQLLDGLRALGLNASSAQIESAVKELGLGGREDGEAVRAVFIHLKRNGI
jgi:hypothetical protein